MQPAQQLTVRQILRLVELFESTGKILFISLLTINQS
jgi:hypothetical protein